MITFADLVDHVVVYAGRDNTRATVDVARRAAQQACSNLHSYHDWRWFRKEVTLPIDQVYSTGTLTYDLPSNTMTLTGGVWPTWSVYGLIRIGDIDYEVRVRNSDTVVTLSPQSHPESSITMATPYLIQRFAYPLPADFNAAVECVRQPFRDILHYRSNNSSSISWMSNSSQLWYTINRSTQVRDQFDLWVGSRSNIDGTISLQYKAKNPLLRYDRYENGLYTVASGSQSVAAVNAMFNSTMIGQYLRLSPDRVNFPTNMFGNNPFAFESQISSVTPPETLGIAIPADQNYTNVKGIISSQIDCADGAMYDFLCRDAEKQFRLISRSVPSGPEEMRQWRESLNNAKDDDSRYTGTSTIDYSNYFPVDYVVSNTVIS